VLFRATRSSSPSPFGSPGPIGPSRTCRTKEGCLPRQGMGSAHTESCAASRWNRSRIRKSISGSRHPSRMLILQGPALRGVALQFCYVSVIKANRNVVARIPQPLGFDGEAPKPGSLPPLRSSPRAILPQDHRPRVVKTCSIMPSLRCDL